jgi:Peptidase A4 family
MKNLVVSLLLGATLILSVFFGPAVSGVKASTSPAPAGAGSLPCVQPDHTKDPASLSASERMAQGYPLPVKGQDTSAIDKVIHQRGVHHCTATPVKSPVRSHPQPQGKVTAGSGYLTGAGNSLNWVGNVADSQNYNASYAQWNVGCIAYGTNDHYSMWVGLGGDPGNLVQTGIEGDNDGSGPTYYAWVENIGANPGYALGVFSVSCGDLVYAEALAPNYMYIVDYTSGASSWQSYGPAATEASAECVVERPDIGGHFSYLSNFGTVTFNTCIAGVDGGAAYYMGDLPHHFWILRDGTGTTLAFPGSLADGSGSFSVYWQAYGDNGSL